MFDTGPYQLDAGGRAQGLVVHSVLSELIGALTGVRVSVHAQILFYNLARYSPLETVKLFSQDKDNVKLFSQGKDTGS